MIHEFEVLKDNLKAFYISQKGTKAKIVRMEERVDVRKEARASFLKEVEALLNRFK
jgi:hypothetical protein